MSTRLFMVYLVPLSILGVAAYGCWEGVPQDVVNAVRAGNIESVRRALDRDPEAVHTKVYPQAFERVSEQQKYRTNTGRSPWQGKYVIHDAVDRTTDPLPMLNLLADAGADLGVRLEGRTLLHLAAQAGNLEVAGWLIDRGADLRAVNDCAEPCDERGQTPLHDLAFRADDMSVLLLDRGAPIAATDARGRTALHAAADRGQLGAAFMLCRYGADPSIADTAGKTPYELASDSPADRPAQRPEGLSQLEQWIRPDGGCAIVARMARTAGAPVSEDDARKVFGETVVIKDPS